MSRPAILITGGAKRVGASLSRHFAQNGYDIALHYHSSGAEATQLQADIKKLGVNCEIFAHDLQDISSIPSFMDKVKKAMPNLSVLVNNASIFERASFMETDEALFDRQLAVNFKAPFFLTQAFVRAFGKGCVINILDTDIAKTQGSHFAYLLSKKALGDFTAMAARELGSQVRVNGVCPGIVLPSNELDEPYMEKLSQKLPLGSVAQLQDIADATQMLCEHPFMTGQLIYTDGGQHLL